MKFYRFNHDTKTKVLASVEDDHHPINSDFHGQSKIKGWTTIGLETLYKNHTRIFRITISVNLCSQKELKR